MKLPKILEPGMLEDINNYLCKKTGCFAFLISNLQWKYSEPKTGKEAFEQWSVALYTIYHDYGCDFLSYLLSDENAATNRLAAELKKSRMHVRIVTKVLRGNFAHGILDLASRDEMKNQVAQFYIKCTTPDNWSKYFESLTEDDWLRAAICLKEDSDLLVKTLYAWADEFEKGLIPCAILKPRERFGNSSKFKTSLSWRVVFDSLDRDYSGNGKRFAYKIIDDRASSSPSQKKSEDVLKGWQDNIQAEFLASNINTPDDIISKLRNLLYAVHNPMEDSSIAISERCGFSFEGF